MVFKKSEKSKNWNGFKKGHYSDSAWKKGNIPWNKGKKLGSLSEEVRRKISLSNIGKHKFSPEGIEKLKIKCGHPQTDETKRKISSANKGHTGFWCKGKKIDRKVYPNFGHIKGWITPTYRLIRDMEELIKWRKAIFERDDWTCQNCGKTYCLVEAHHLKPFYLIIKENIIKSVEDARKCKELWSLENGQTLCKDCHNLTRGRKKCDISISI